MKKFLFVILSVLLCLPFSVDAYEIKESSVDYINYNSFTSVDSVVVDDTKFVSIGSTGGRIYVYQYDLKRKDYKTNVDWRLNLSVVDGSVDVSAIEKFSDGSFLIVGHTKATAFTISRIYNVYDKVNDKYEQFSDEEKNVTVSNVDYKDALMIKIDKNGNLLWVKTFGTDEDDIIFDVKIDAKDNIFCVGRYGGYGYGGIFKFDSNGNQLKQFLVSTWSTNLLSLAISNKGQIAVVGSTTYNPFGGYTGSCDYNHIPLLLIFNENLELVGEDFYGFTTTNVNERLALNPNYDENLKSCMDPAYYLTSGFFDVIFDSDNNIVVVGRHNPLSDKSESNDYYLGFIAKYNIEGKFINEVETYYVGVGPSYTSGLYDIKQLSNGNYVVAGYTDNHYGEYDSEQLKLSLNSYVTYPYVGIYSKDLKELKFKTFDVSSFKNTKLLFNRLNTFMTVEVFNDESLILTGTANFDNEFEVTGVPFHVSYDITFDITEKKTINGTYEVKEVDGLQVITAVPDKGYILDKVVVTDTDGEEVNLVKNDDGTYSFRLYDDVVVEVKFKSYNITKVESKGGDFKVDRKNGVGYIVPEINEGYEFSKIIVKDSEGKEVTLTKLEDGTYSFELYDDVTVEVLFNKIPKNPKTGIASYGLLLVLVIVLCGAVYYSLNKNKLFKKL